MFLSVAEPRSIVQMFMQLPGVKDDIWVVFGDTKEVKTLMFLCGCMFPFPLGE